MNARYIATVAALLSAGCMRSDTPHRSNATTNSSGEPVITIPTGAAYLLRQDGTNGALVLVGNLDGVLSLTHLTPDGSQSASLEIRDGNPFRITRTIQSPTNAVELYDLDADGIADLKIVRDTTSQQQEKFTRGPLEWIPTNKE